MILVLLCLASVWSNILCFNFAVICIDPQEEGEENENNSEEENEMPDLLRPPITMAVAAGALVANFPAVYLANRFGIRSIFPMFGLISAISTGLMPTCINWGFEYAIAARVFQGIAFACNFPVIGTFTSRWTYYKQNGLFVSTLVAFIQLSPIITNPVSGALCTSSLGWQSVFYGHAIVCAVLFLLFVTLYRNTPEKHPFVNALEASKIARGKSIHLKESLKNIPYRAILKTMSVWAIWIAAIGNFFCVNLVFLFQPTYLHTVLGFGVRETGVTAALPPLLQFGLKLAAGFVSDKIHFLHETTKVKVFNSIAFFGSAILFVILAYIPPSKTFSFITLVAAEGCLGISTGGFFKTSALVSRHFNHFVTGNIALSISSTILMVSFMVNGIAKDSTPEQWGAIFIITSCVLVWTNLFFICIVSAKPASWTKERASSYSETASPISSATYGISPSYSPAGHSPKPILRHTRSDSEVIQPVAKSVGWENNNQRTKDRNNRIVARRNSMKNILVIDI